MIETGNPKNEYWIKIIPKREMYDFFFAETGVNLKDMVTPDKKDITNPVGDIVDAYYICKCLHDSLLG